MASGDTVEGSSTDVPGEARVPGVVAVFSVAGPMLQVLPLVDGAVELGRMDGDEAASRRHARASFERGRWQVADLGSRNGTFVNGAAAAQPVVVAAPAVVRAGQGIYLLLDDVRPLAAGVVVRDDRRVVGPALQAALARIERAGRGGGTLLLTGESGTGKEMAARAYHAAGRHAGGPFLAVNCAAIPEGVAERLLFGTTRGAYSGAVEAAGYIESCDGGVLFLDEIADLDPQVQPKLLRALESGEVLPLGAARPRRVDTHYLFATSLPLRAAMKQGRFRPELYFRISGDEVVLPPLRQRAEDIPWLVAWQLARTGPAPDALTAGARLVEACLLRPWPGNVRELLHAVRRAGEEAIAQGSQTVRLSHLDPAAGTGGDEGGAPEEPKNLDADRVRATIAACDGNLSAVARELGLHRSQLYRLLKRLGIERD
jgi:DNA-binding NtrC family response regulator